MKILLSMFIFSIFVLLHHSLQCKNAGLELPVPDSGIYYKNFASTTYEYNFDCDYDKIIKELFGPEYRLAEWKDLVDFHKNGGNIKELFTELQLTDVAVKRAGGICFTENSYFYATLKNPGVPENPQLSFLNFDTIADKVNLRAWGNDRKILAIKKTVKEK